MKSTKIPDYKLIFEEILNTRHPEKRKECSNILSKKNLSSIDVLKLNKLIFQASGKSENFKLENHKAYDRETILYILDYQKKNKLNNSQLAEHFKLSRNTVAKWKKIFTI